MNAPNSRTAPVDLGVDAPSGGRSNPTTRNEKGTTIMTQPTDEGTGLVHCDNCGRYGWHTSDRCPDRQPTDVDENGAFTGDRYERLRKSAEILANDENIVSGDFPYNSEGLRAYVASIEQLGLLDRLTDHDADTVSMFAVIDYTRGADRMAWRIYDLMQDEPTVEREDDDDAAVLYALICILRLLVAAFIEPDPGARLRGLMLEVEDAHGDLRAIAADADDDQSGPLHDSVANLLAAKAAIADAIGALG
jgi:hypothetical protein